MAARLVGRVADFLESYPIIKYSLIGTSLLTVAILIMIQLIPYGRDHSNPLIQSEPPWDSTETRDLAVRACYDCHSNEVRWPWYSNFAPVSWLVQIDVDVGRESLNFSEWDEMEFEPEDLAGIAETVRENEMPFLNYLWLHPAARLSTEERRALARGLDATVGVPVIDTEVMTGRRGVFRYLKARLAPKLGRRLHLLMYLGGGMLFGGMSVVSVYWITRLTSRRLIINWLPVMTGIFFGMVGMVSLGVAIWLLVI